MIAPLRQKSPGLNDYAKLEPPKAALSSKTDLKYEMEAKTVLYFDAYFNHLVQKMINRTISIILHSALCFLLFLSFTGSVKASEPATLSVKSSAIADGTSIAKKYTGDGEDFSPPLSWSKGPANTKSYAISCEDPDAPVGTWWHWIIFNLSPNTTSLAENVPKVALLQNGASQGLNDFGKYGYNGPAPPGGKVHHYLFKVVALDTTLSLKKNADKNAYEQAIKGHVLARGELTGTYKR